MNKYQVRKIKQNEFNCLKTFLYEAIFQPDEGALLPRDVIETPEIALYINNFGQKKEDSCFVTEFKTRIIGAVWTRILADEIKGYGNIDDTTPEFAISVFKEHRNKGVGTALMKKMIADLKEKGHTKASLSVAKKNDAFRFYQRLGFKILDEQEEDYLMVLNLIQ